MVTYRWVALLQCKHVEGSGKRLDQHVPPPYVSIYCSACKGLRQILDIVIGAPDGRA